MNDEENGFEEDDLTDEEITAPDDGDEDDAVIREKRDPTSPRENI